MGILGDRLPSTTEIVLPREMGARYMADVFAVAARIKQAPGDVTLDAAKLEFIDPLGFAVLAALLCDVRAAGRQVRMNWLSLDVAGYMERMDFFKHCDVEGVEVDPGHRNDKRLSLVELTKLDSVNDVDRVASGLAHAMTGLLTKASPDAPMDRATGRNTFTNFSHPLEYALSELLGNAMTHARRHGHMHSSVWVAAQYYQGPAKVRIAVVDDGCGMLRSLQNHPALAEPSHFAAIEAALEPRVSCNRNGDARADDSAYIEHGNQGVGLTTTSRIAMAARGYLSVVSGNAKVSTRGERDSFRELPEGGFWNGVAITLECERSKLPTIRIPELLPPADADDLNIQFS